MTTLIGECLLGCSGCEMSLLNQGPELLELLGHFELLHFPLLMDHKTHPPEKTGRSLRLPRADIGLVSGAINNREQARHAQAMREQCTLLIGFGTCAACGGIPAMLNRWGNQAGLSAVFQDQADKPSSVPGEDLPAPLDRVYALDEVVEPDVIVPGCPPHPRVIAGFLLSLARREEAVLPAKSVCDTCPAVRLGRLASARAHRFLTSPSEKTKGSLRCLLEQGFVCMGPVTAAGCAGNGTPPCIDAQVPCRGCFGPSRKNGNQMLEMINALISSGVDYTSIMDRKGLLRFSGAHGLLRLEKRNNKR